MTLIETLKDFIIVFGYYRPRSDVGKSDFNRRLDESEKIGSDDNIYLTSDFVWRMLLMIIKG